MRVSWNPFFSHLLERANSATREVPQTSPF